MNRYFGSMLAVAAGALAVPAVANADWVYRVGGAYMVTEQGDIEVNDSGGELWIDDDGPVVSGDVTWIFTDHLGIELWISDTLNSGIFYRDANGQTGVDDVDLQSPTASLQWHFNPEGWIRPYVGAGIAYTMVDDSRLGRVDIDDDTSWTVGGGIDIGQPRSGFLVNLYAKYIDFSPEAEISKNAGLPAPAAGGSNGDAGNWDINPVVYGVNVGYRFGREPERPVDTVPPVPPPPAVAAAAAPAKCADADGDGVCDSGDRCPNSPAGARVGAHGCPCDVSIETHFAFDSADLTAADKAELDHIAERMKSLDFVIGEAGGHTDSVGDEAYNQRLSERRARAVYDYLVSRGVGSGRVNVVGYGERRPVADNATEAGKAQNRRVVLRRTDCGPAL
jgi:outer membrane protein OmpA-like peptidoglycan-associated protein/outer membrane protein W